MRRSNSIAGRQDPKRPASSPVPPKVWCLSYGASQGVVCSRREQATTGIPTRKPTDGAAGGPASPAKPGCVLKKMSLVWKRYNEYQDQERCGVWVDSVVFSHLPTRRSSSIPVRASGTAPPKPACVPTRHADMNIANHSPFLGHHRHCDDLLHALTETEPRARYPLALPLPPPVEQARWPRGPPQQAQAARPREYCRPPPAPRAGQHQRDVRWVPVLLWGWCVCEIGFCFGGFLASHPQPLPLRQRQQRRGPRQLAQPPRDQPPRPAPPPPVPRRPHEAPRPAQRAHAGTRQQARVRARTGTADRSRPSRERLPPHPPQSPRIRREFV
jgi:hypothetical protein